MMRSHWARLRATTGFGVARPGVLTRLVAAAALIIAASTAGSPSAIAATHRPGTVLSHASATTSDTIVETGATATKITYATTGDDGPTVRASAVVFRPAGHRPAGGWPIIALAHGTTGVTPECAPSLTTNLAGLDSTVAKMITNGWSVVAPDYRGLGDTNVAHRYHVAKDTGWDILDSLRAARNLLGTPTAKTAMYGISQGALGVAKASEMAQSYAPDLALSGAVMDSPGLKIVGVVKRVDRHTLSPVELSVYPYYVSGVLSLNPDLSWSDFLAHSPFFPTGTSAPKLYCSSSTDGMVYTLLEANPLSVRFKTAAARQAMTEYFLANQLPQVSTPIPLYISRGNLDQADPAAWQTPQIAKMCMIGDVVAEDIRLGGHFSTKDADVQKRLSWLTDRFAGRPAPSTCPA